MDKETIAEIKNSVNIVDVIGEVVALTKNGRNFLGLCPFHGEKTPSFNVVEDKQFYHCFGCGKSGDVFKFIEEYQGVPFLEAVNTVAERAGIAIDYQPQAVQQIPKSHPHQRLYDLHAVAAKFYHAILMTTTMGEAARSYLYKRGLTDEVIKHFQLGLAPSDNSSLYQRVREDFSEEEIFQSGLFHLSEGNLVFDAFQDRIMFPLADDQGRVIAFSGRVWKEGAVNDQGQVAKYKNSRATAIFNKSYELYHLDKALPVIKKSHEVYLMEGFMDVIAAYQSGIENAVASMGTALTSDHVRHLGKYTKKVVIAYDGDKAGQAATAKAIDELGTLSVEIIVFPEQLDPDEFLQKNSPEKLYDFLTKSRISKVEFLINHLKPDNLENLQAQIDFVERMAPIIAQTPSITAQNSYIYLLADLLSHFDYSQVEQAVNRVRVAGREQRRANTYQSEYSMASLPVGKHLSRLIRAENTLLYRMVHNPVVLNDFRLREDFHFETTELQVLYETLCRNGEVDSQTLSAFPDSVQQAWYSVLEENLPEEFSTEELEEVERVRNQEILRYKNQQIGKKVREASHNGDVDVAVQEIERLIAQKRRME